MTPAEAAEEVRAAGAAVLHALELRRWEEVLPACMAQRESALQALGAALLDGALPPTTALELLDQDTRIGEALSLRQMELERERRALRTGRSAEQRYGGPVAMVSRYLDQAG